MVRPPSCCRSRSTEAPMTRSLPLAATLLLLSAVAAGSASCGDTTPVKPVCATDNECIQAHDSNPNWYCYERNQCACKNDEACQEREHCNAREAGGDGLCHPDRECETNADCGKGEKCGDDKICRKGCI